MPCLSPPHFNLYEPFGLGRLATDHSLKKVASRPLFIRVRGYTRLNHFLEYCYTISMHDYPGYSLDASQSGYFEVCLLLYIHMKLLKVSYSESAYLFAFVIQ